MALTPLTPAQLTVYRDNTIIKIRLYAQGSLYCKSMGLTKMHCLENQYKYILTIQYRRCNNIF